MNPQLLSSQEQVKPAFVKQCYPCKKVKTLPWLLNLAGMVFLTVLALFSYSVDAHGDPTNEFILGELGKACWAVRTNAPSIPPMRVESGHGRIHHLLFGHEVVKVHHAHPNLPAPWDPFNHIHIYPGAEKQTGIVISQQINGPRINLCQHVAKGAVPLSEAELLQLRLRYQELWPATAPDFRPNFDTLRTVTAGNRAPCPPSTNIGTVNCCAGPVMALYAAQQEEENFYRQYPEGYEWYPSTEVKYSFLYSMWETVIWGSKISQLKWLSPAFLGCKGASATTSGLAATGPIVPVAAPIAISGTTFVGGTLGAGVIVSELTDHLYEEQFGKTLRLITSEPVGTRPRVCSQQRTVAELEAVDSAIQALECGATTFDQLSPCLQDAIMYYRPGF